MVEVWSSSDLSDEQDATMVIRMNASMKIAAVRNGLFTWDLSVTSVLGGSVISRLRRIRRLSLVLWCRRVTKFERLDQQQYLVRKVLRIQRVR